MISIKASLSSRLRVVSLLFFLVPETMQAGIPMINMAGSQVVASGDYPLLIGVHELSVQIIQAMYFRSPDLAYKIGFLEYAVIDNVMLSSSRVSRLASDTILNSRRFSYFAKYSEQAVEFNGRVMVNVHGNDLGEVSRTDASEGDQISGEEFGRRLGALFKDLKMDVKRVDLLMCCGDRVTPRVKQGLQEAGMGNLEVRGFEGTLGLTKDFKQIRLDEENTVAQHYTDAVDFIVRGENSFPENVKVTERLGIPPPVTEPNLDSVVSSGNRCALQ